MPAGAANPGWYLLLDLDTGRELLGLYASLNAARSKIRALAGGKVNRPPRPPLKHLGFTKHGLGIAGTYRP